MDTFALDKGRLQLANSYTINNTGDCSYYLLNIWKQLGYDQEHDELHLTGDNVAYRQQVQTSLKNIFDESLLLILKRNSIRHTLHV